MNLLIIGRLNGELITASKIAQQNGAKVKHAADHISALNLLRNGNIFDIIFMDLELDIQAFIHTANQEKIFINLVACGIDADSQKAVDAIKLGAKEYLPLPPDASLIAAILESLSLCSSENAIIGSSQVFKNLLQICKKVAPSHATVLILGKSGTGKEEIAKFIHKNSARSNMNLISINCAAIPEALLESELFGHEKGAFTGASERRIGKFEAANKSTILLDEISEMDLSLQAKLLRVLQEKEIVRLGSNTPIKIDARIIATSNRNLLEYVKEGKFREDLFYRLNVIEIEMPSLNQRKEDIKELAEFFIKKYAKLNNVPPKNLSSDALEKLLHYEWPGNVRELENTIHRALLLSSYDEITSEDIILITKKAANSDNQNIENKILEDTMNYCHGDYEKAAMVLGISLKILKTKLDTAIHKKAA